MYIKTVTARGFRAGVAADLTCHLPGRFTLLVGANNAGKTTICEALYLAHRHRFPQLQRPSAGALRRASDGPRELVVGCAFEQDPAVEGPLGRKLAEEGAAAPEWTRGLSRSLGRIRVHGAPDAAEEMRVIYLPAHRNPVDELARREAEVLVELLRAEQQRTTGHRSLHPLRRRAEHLLDQLAAEGLVQTLEGRLHEVMTDLSGGVAHQWPFFGGQAVDDQFLARVLELLLAPQADRGMGERLELSGLGYVNLLHMAVTLAAIPDLEAAAEPPDPAADGAARVEPADGAAPAGDEAARAQAEAAEARAEIDEADEQAAAEEDSFFQGVFHATVIIEEPEAHLHPQLQQGLIRHLRQVVLDRPELQVVVSSHAPDLIASVQPEDVVVVRRTPQGRRTFALADLPGPNAAVKTTLRMAALHLDASRSASLFAERLVLVEGVTDALVLRQLGRHWAGEDPIKQQFVHALTVVPIGCKVGEWPVRLLATQGFELAQRVAVLTDSDDRTNDEPSPPQWVAGFHGDTFIYRMSHPTFEPSLAVAGNDAVITAALTDIGIDVPAVVDGPSIDALFRSKTTNQPAGPAASAKGEFAYALAARLAAGELGTVVVPEHVVETLNFVFDGLGPMDDPEAGGTPDGGAPGPGGAPEPFGDGPGLGAPEA